MGVIKLLGQQYTSPGAENSHYSLWYTSSAEYKTWSIELELGLREVDLSHGLIFHNPKETLHAAVEKMIFL